MRVSRWITYPSVIALSAVGAVGAVLSFETLRVASVGAFGETLSYGFPLLVDLMILGSLLAYIRTAKLNRPMIEWRIAAHAAVAGTIFLNLYASRTPSELAWHLIPPVAWSVLCELVARQVLGQYRSSLPSSEDRIQLRQWITSPIESTRAWILKARFGSETFWRTVGEYSAARTVIAQTVDDPHVRRVLRRQLRMGSLTPGAALAACGWSGGQIELRDSRQVLQAALSGVLAPSVPAVPTPDSLGKEPPSVPGQGQETAPEPPVTKPTKRALIVHALMRAGGVEKTAIDLLKADGHDITDSYVYRVAREENEKARKRTDVQSNVTALHA